MHTSRKPLTIVLAAGLALALASPAAAAETWKIDPAHANIYFKASHFGWSNQFGRFNDVSGTITLDPNDASKTRVTLVIKAASVDTGHEARDKHLRSPDFFNAAEHPEIRFVSTKVEKTGDRTANVTGNLTLLGTTKPVTLKVTWNKVGQHFRTKKTHTGFSATTTIKRSAWGMKKFAPNLGDDITLYFEIEAVKQ